ncbi:MAG: SRPBCC family protein [Gammaproteobacteria bacterium]|nr:SRPBCC family protein [Gammaproteobacteria bacterium]NND60375.1 SRPBCC family protein [Gammaproteobacteria bacterium]
MPSFTVTRRIDRPRAEVFEVFTDFDSMPQRIDGIANIEILTQGPVGEGTRWRETRKMFGNKSATEEMEITGFEPERSYTVEADSHGTHYRSVYNFDAVGHSTDVTCTFEAKPVSLMAKVMSPLGVVMMGATKKIMAADIDDLKRVVEHDS